MKLFKILSISIISIFFFHSQIYGINLRCDFNQILEVEDVNSKMKKEFVNGVGCSRFYGELCRVNSEDNFHRWISEVIIKNKDVVIINEQSNYTRSKTNNEEKRKFRRREKERKLIVESVVHNTSSGFSVKNNYFFVIRDVSLSGIISFYTLMFNNLSGESILIEYTSTLYKEKYMDWTNSHFGKCRKM